ncbi:MAG TPA: hypothetical protein PK178_14610 [Smithellaceae bacterium]|nr:hypothetical protein [Smithellaceae bacterium]
MVPKITSGSQWGFLGEVLSWHRLPAIGGDTLKGASLSLKMESGKSVY